MRSACRFFVLVILPMMEVFCSVLHPLFLESRLPFLGLMVRSVVCAVGMLYIFQGAGSMLLQHAL
jgi:hypothetical protein